MARVVFDNVTKRFGEVTALHGFSLEIEDGEFVVLVGPSGSGKTTALRLIAGLEAISEGEIRVGDRVVNRLAPRDRDIAMVFQDYALYPQMTVYENLAFGLKMRKMSRAEIDRRVRHAAEMLDIGELLQRKPRALSGGQRQRVALGRAIVREPQAFLMDEPLSNLDAKLRAQTRSEIKHIQAEIGTTTVYVTHDQVEAMTMGDRIAVMSAGVLQQVGSPKDLYDRPENVFVAAFIGSPAMNFARAQVDDGALAIGSGRWRLPAGAPFARGQEVLVGFRPEHVELSSGGASGALELPARVDVVEYLGNEELVHIEADGNEFVALVSSDRSVRTGETVALTVPPEKLHVFDPGTERRVEAA